MTKFSSDLPNLFDLVEACGLWGSVPSIQGVSLVSDEGGYEINSTLVGGSVCSDEGPSPE